MFRLKLKQLMKEKGVKAPNAALKRFGISHAIAHKYMNSKGQWIEYKHMEKICQLLRCTPNDLLEWVPDDKLHDQPDHPLQALKPREPFDLLEATKNMSPDEVRLRLGPNWPVNGAEKNNNKPEENNNGEEKADEKPEIKDSKKDGKKDGKGK